MARERVLVIESDEWESAALKRMLVESHHEVEVAGTARDGFACAKAWGPDLIICDLELPDIDGLWVARMVRLDPTGLSMTPFLFLSADRDKEARLQAFNVGADLFLTKPYRTEDAVAQVIALLAMARRMENRVSFGPSSSTIAPAMRGDIAQIDLSTVLTLLEMERRTGFLKVRTSGGETISFEMLDGALARCTNDDAPADPAAMFCKVFGWKEGRFWFRAAPVAPGSQPASAIGPLMLDAMRLMDESAR